ncbi:MAG: UDP-N-acetylmuramoyl-L-alanine--D-glutamate ligase [Gammaproteobacteria bacterium]|nr:MAG: UDP-N-acetylmuramoyl-L-alanine--D-glutamate ligase [Gammaproteobacteria bacterium]
MGLALQKQDASNFRDTVVIGLGETGLSVAQYLSKHDIAFSMFDTRSNPPQLAAFKRRFPSAEIYLGELVADAFAHTAQVIISPGVDINQDALREAVEANECECIGDIELFARSTTTPVVAITGSNGKSTVTSLLAEMARLASVNAYAGGNLGPPALDLLDHNDAELFVLELSSFQLESTQSLQPEVSVVLNISPDHLDRHGDVNNYAHIKEHVYSNAKISVINRDDEYVSHMQTTGKVISFGLGDPLEGQFGITKENQCSYLSLGAEQLVPVSVLALQGESGVLNSLAALAVGHALQLPMQAMLEKLKNFKGLPHRLALVAEQDGVSWFNDSKGTNIGATISSLRSLQKNIVLIAGGVFKGGDLAQLKEAIAKHVKHVILLGQDANVLQLGIEGVSTIDIANSMNEAVEIAQKESIAGDQVLLSPACASFDMYKNYIERGSHFENCVKDLLL